MPTLPLGAEDTLTKLPITTGPVGPIVSHKHTIAYKTPCMSKRTKHEGRMFSAASAAIAGALGLEGSGEFEKQHKGQ